MRFNIAATFLNSHRLLEHYYLSGCINDSKRIKEYIFVELHNIDPYKPDYIYKNMMLDFINEKSIDELIIDSVAELSTMLEFRNNRVYVKDKLFKRWQDIILSFSPLVIISYLIYEQSSKRHTLDVKKLVSSILDKSALPSIFEPQLDYMIEKTKLNEMHMHLNGSTEVDFVWQDALMEPSKFYKHFYESFGNTNVIEQYLQLGNLEQSDLFRLLIIARQLRDRIIGIVFDGVKKESPESFTKDKYNMSDSITYVSIVHPLASISNEVDFNASWQYEALLFIKSFEYLQLAHNRYFANLVHYYLLIYTFFHQMLVQQKQQVGFDQFQKITQNQIRELTEEKYQNRYRQLQGMYGNSLSVLEGRFAPKDNLVESYKLLKSIQDGYTKNKKIEKSFKLILVPHFVKIADKRYAKDIITFRDLDLRLKTKRTLDVLLKTMQEDKYRNLIVGFDAAANELHASPEVFSPIFRKLQFLGYNNFTYHAGEDFIHLISGLRMVYEAVEFLEMSSGNRIGHATALGIDPQLWTTRLGGSKLTLKKGEWLDNLIFAYEIIQKYSDLYKILPKLEAMIFQYFEEIYQYRKVVYIHQIIESWKARKYDPFFVLGWREPSIFDQFSLKEFEKFTQLDIIVQELYQKYHMGECIERYNEMIQIEPDQAPFDYNTLYDLQNIMLEHVNEKNIALEVLPTSNVRISYYHSYEEHHLWRWLGIKNYRENDPKPTVVVGSDDTGIFMTNLRNEYAHIYQTVNKLTDSQVALKIVEDLDKNSKIFTFKI